MTSVGCDVCGHTWTIEGPPPESPIIQREHERKQALMDRDLRNALQAARDRPGVCPGYGPDVSCGAPVTHFLYLVDDPTAYCETHAMHAAAFWDAHGFPPTPFVRLSDGQFMKFRVVVTRRGE
ncbi:MAG: hypothetical protein AB7F99_08290 [Vicinamibacterales bacterium]